MPVFFFLSGFCFKEKYLDSPWEYLKRKLKGIWWPFVKYNVFFLVIHNLLVRYKVIDGDYNTIFYTAKQLLAYILMWNWDHTMLGGYWFVHDLFFATIAIYVLIKLLKKKVWTGIICCLLFCAFLKYYEIDFLRLINPRFLLVVSIMLAGYCFKYYKKSIIFVSMGGAISAFALLIVCSLGRFVCLQKFNLGDIPSYFVLSIIGSILLITLAAKLVRYDRCFHFKYMGKNTMAILTWHFLCFKLITFLRIIVEDRSIDELTTFPVITGGNWWIPYTVVGVLFPLGIAYLSKIIKSYINK